MRIEDITVEVCDRNLQRLGIILNRDLDMTIATRFNDYGEWWITLPMEHEMVQHLSTPGARVVVTGYDGIVLISGPVVGENRRTYNSDPKGKVVFNGVSDDILLDYRLAYPDPARPVSDQQKARDKRTNHRETLIHQFVSVNLGIAALPDRRDTRLVMGPDLDRGGLISKSARFDNLLLLCADIAGGTGLGFRIVQDGEQLRFETYMAVDRTKEIRLDVENSTLSEDEIAYYAPTASRVLVAGQGEGVDRVLIERTNANTATVENSYGRIERFLDQRGSEDVAELTDAGDSMLAAEAMIGTTTRAVPMNDTTMQYGRDWFLGDRVTVVINDQEITDIVTGAAFSFGPDGVRSGIVIGLTEAQRTGARSADRRLSYLERNQDDMTYENIENNIDPKGDLRQPAAPTGLSGTSRAYLDINGTAKAAVTLSWSAVTTASMADGGEPIEIRGYQVLGRHSDQVAADWTILDTTTSTGIELATKFDPNTEWEFSVRAVSRNNIWGLEAPYITIVMEDDAVAPPPTSAPTIVYERGTATAVWDGLTATGTAMPADFNHVRVHVSTSSAAPADDALHFGVLFKEGEILLPIEPYGTVRYVRFQSVDDSGNRLGWSNPTAFTTEPMPGGDLAVNSVTAQHLESVLVVSNLFVAGEVNGAAAEMSENGIYVYIEEDEEGQDVPVGTRRQYPFITLGDTGENALNVTTGRTPDTVAGIGSDGTLTGTFLQTSEDPSLNGRFLMGAWENRWTDGSGDRDSLMWHSGWGIVATMPVWNILKDAGQTSGSLSTTIPSGVDQFLAWTTVNVFAGRTYQLELTNANANVTPTGESTVWNSVEAGIYVTSATLGTTPPKPTMANAELNAFVRDTGAGTFVRNEVSLNMKGDLRVSADATRGVGVMIRGRYADINLNRTGHNPWRLNVIDVGPTQMDETGAVYAISGNPETSPKRRYTYYFDIDSTIYQYQDGTNATNNSNTFTFSGVRQTKKMVQGRAGSSSYPYNSKVRFGGNTSISGSHQTGVSLSSVVSGAAKVESRLRMTCAYSNRSSVRARVGWGDSTGSANPSPQVSSASVSAGGTTTLVMPDAFNTYIKSHGSDLVISFGPGSSSSTVDGATFYGSDGKASQRLRLQVDVWK